MSEVTVEHLGHPLGCFWILKVDDHRFYWWRQQKWGARWQPTSGWDLSAFHEPRDDCKIIEHFA